MAAVSRSSPLNPMSCVVLSLDRRTRMQLPVYELDNLRRLYAAVAPVYAFNT